MRGTAASTRRIARFLDAGIEQNLLGHLGEAATYFQQALALEPRFAEAHYNLGNVKQKQGDLPGAIACYRRSIALRRDCFEFHFNLAAALFASGQVADAVHSFAKAASLRPDHVDALYSLGVALHESGDLEKAAESYHQVLRRQPEHAQALCNLGAVYTELGDPGTAALLLRRSLSIRPSAPDAHCNLGKAHSRQGNAGAAIECFRQALALQPGHVLSLCNLGAQLELLGDLEAAAGCYRLALQRDSGHALARFSLGLALLAGGDFANGWRDYEYRWETPAFRKQKRNLPHPQWRGERFEPGKARIFVHSEQGLGDMLQFVRYIPMLAAEGANVILEVQPNLYRMVKNLGGLAHVLRPGEALPEFDWQCPLLSLPLGFHTELGTIPANVPYIWPDQSEARAWSERFDHRRLCIGITWSGNPKHSREADRSIPLEQLAQLSRIPGTAFFSLQKGAAAAAVRALPPEFPVTDLDTEQTDFADTAAIVANLDLVISIDTSVAHLAGAMGKPVWILLHSAPDWRWLRGRDSTPWYPTARLFRQSTSGNWTEVVERVAASLQRSVHDLADPASSGIRMPSAEIE